VREFSDGEGRVWRAWEVHPEAIYPLTRAEDYLAGCYRDGWLVFETADGQDKRRLCPPPYAWDQREAAELEKLLERAERLRPVGAKRPRGVVPADLPPSVPPDIAVRLPRDEQGNLELRYLGVVRSFRYPGGQVWRVRVVGHDDDATAPVLRFASETHYIDLTEWPAEWADLSDEDLSELLRIGESIQDRRRDDAPRRCHDDSRPTR
jgi:hypothetical protein